MPVVTVARQALCFETTGEIGTRSVPNGGYPGSRGGVVAEFFKKGEVKTFSSKHSFKFTELLKNIYLFGAPNSL